MSSGSLPFDSYHRTHALGEGSFGSVVTVYNDDGEEFAMKLFAPDDEDEDDPTLEVGALLEISVLRLLREDNGHPNIVPLADIQGSEGDEEEEGAGTAGCLGMAMPLYPLGSLHQAINQKAMIQTKEAKISIAQGLLSAVHHLHRNGIMHRDIKSDNVVLELDSNGVIKPVLIDFSLVRIVDSTMFGNPNKHFPPLKNNNNKNAVASCAEDYAGFLTGGCGTAMYMSPEVYECEPYGTKADMWSVGVVMLEVLLKKNVPDVKTSQAHTIIQQGLSSLPIDKPFPTLTRHLLKQAPAQRWSAPRALEYMSQTIAECKTLNPPLGTIINLSKAVPLGDDDGGPEEENVAPNNKKTPRNKKRDPVLERRVSKIRQLCTQLECVHPLTQQAAFCYCQQMLELDEDLDDLEASQSMLDCVLLAHKVFEVEVISFTSVNDSYPSFANWDLDTYKDNESTLFLMLDYCLYPRELLDLDNLHR